MSDLSITAANIVSAAGSTRSTGIAGEAITRGQSVYLKESDGKYWKADNDSTAAIAAAVGIALTDSAAGQPLVVHEGGNLAFGAILTVGEIYCVSSNAGGICPEADVGSGDFVTLLGVATTTSNLAVRIQASGAQVPA